MYSILPTTDTREFVVAVDIVVGSYEVVFLPFICNLIDWMGKAEWNNTKKIRWRLKHLRACMHACIHVSRHLYTIGMYICINAYQWSFDVLSCLDKLLFASNKMLQILSDVR